MQEYIRVNKTKAIIYPLREPTDYKVVFLSEVIIGFLLFPFERGVIIMFRTNWCVKIKMFYGADGVNVFVFFEFRGF